MLRTQAFTFLFAGEFSARQSQDSLALGPSPAEAEFVGSHTVLQIPGFSLEAALKYERLAIRTNVEAQNHQAMARG